LRSSALAGGRPGFNLDFMSSDSVAAVAAAGRPGTELSERLGQLFKHAQQRLEQLTSAALEPFGISGRELTVLLVLDELGPSSQVEVAARLGVDRTTMVALVDGLETKGLVVRGPFARDRRRKAVSLTEGGRARFLRALAASDAAEHEFLAAMDGTSAAVFRAQLRALSEAAG
jgi:DNA-binding MarR family transcriptional regulator